MWVCVGVRVVVGRSVVWVAFALPEPAETDDLVARRGLELADAGAADRGAFVWRIALEGHVAPKVGGQRGLPTGVALRVAPRHADHELVQREREVRRRAVTSGHGAVSHSKRPGAVPPLVDVEHLKTGRAVSQPHHTRTHTHAHKKKESRGLTTPSGGGGGG